MSLTLKFYINKCIYQDKSFGKLIICKVDKITDNTTNESEVKKAGRDFGTNYALILLVKGKCCIKI